MAQKIIVSLIIEVLGRPAENVALALEEVLKSIEKEDGVKLIQKTTHEPKKIEPKENQKITKEQELFTSFLELELEFDGLRPFVMFIFKYMPSHVEVLKPEQLTIPNTEISEIMTGVNIRMHKYDEVVRILLVEKEKLEEELKKGKKKNETKRK
ncbi:MAG: hypothetical protein WC533_00495 [Candidatus Pacearchaeota archaeon]